MWGEYKISYDKKGIYVDTECAFCKEISRYRYFDITEQGEANCPLCKKAFESMPLWLCKTQYELDIGEPEKEIKNKEEKEGN